MLLSSGAMGTRQPWAAAAVTLLLCLSVLSAALGKEHKETYFSPGFELNPGDVSDKYYLMQFPTGHIAIRNFFAEVVDDEGNSVPLYEAYLHHWVMLVKNVKKDYKELMSSVPKVLSHSSDSTVYLDHSGRIPFKDGADPKQINDNLRSTNQGSCRGGTFLAAGSETRHTNMTIPAPYGIVVGDPETIPEGYEQAFYLNVHAIDTREAVDATSCLECLCESYGASTDSKGRPLSEGYRGGLQCCPDEAHCAVKYYEGAKQRTLFLKYTITWVDWDKSVVPLRKYGLDVTDPRTSFSEPPICKVEYEVPQCTEGTPKSQCIDHRHSIGAVDVGGDLIYGWMHHHAGGLGGVITRKDGVVVCSSDPIYGKSSEPGDEAGYIVGMTACYPEPGTAYLGSMEELHFSAYYSNEKAHTGVMSVFFLYVADPIPYITEVTE